MSKKSPKVKFSGQTPVSNVLTAVIPESVSGRKIAFPHRYSYLVETPTVLVDVEPDHKICFRLVQSLANRGMVATNAPGNFTNGKISVNLLNCGREIIEVRDGEPLIEVWLEKNIPFEWEKNV